MTELTVAGFFAGVGGIEKGFEVAGFTPVWSNEVDPYAAQTFRANHSAHLHEGDIRELDSEDVPEATVYVGGFPCQAFSVAGNRLGFEETRGTLFFDMLRIINANKPEVLLLENVKNLVGHDGGNTFRVIREALAEIGYHIKYKVLNSSEYSSVPQTRERIYIVGFRGAEACANFEWPLPYPEHRKLSVGDIVNSAEKVEDKYYYTPANFEKFDMLAEAITNPETAYQWRRKYVRENKSDLFPTLTANMGTGGHNVPLVLTEHGIRKLTPRECFAVQGFGDITLPAKVSNSQLYKQAGNSVTVPVIARIASGIRFALGN